MCYVGSTVVKPGHSSSHESLIDSKALRSWVQNHKQKVNRVHEHGTGGNRAHKGIMGLMGSRNDLRFMSEVTPTDLI